MCELPRWESVWSGWSLTILIRVVTVRTERKCCCSGGKGGYLWYTRGWNRMKHSSWMRRPCSSAAGLLINEKQIRNKLIKHLILESQITTSRRSLKYSIIWMLITNLITVVHRLYLIASSNCIQTGCNKVYSFKQNQ